MGTNISRNFWSGLNPEQSSAVSHTTGPMMVLAGAGAGKTAVMTRRAARLIRDGVAPSRIMLVTFTNKAAREMRERCIALLGTTAGALVAGTFHSIVIRHILRPAHDRGFLIQLGFAKRFAVLDNRDSKALWKTAWKALQPLGKTHCNAVGLDLKRCRQVVGLVRAQGFEMPPGTDLERTQGRTREEQQLERVILQTLGQAGISPDSATAHWIMETWQRYHAGCRALNAMDFDDILTLGLSVLEREPEWARQIAERFQFIEVDEYQDTNRVQNRIIDILAAAHRNLAVCGDDRQAIYGFRGSDIRVIRDFRDRYPDATVIDLIRNYRSTPSIVEAANGCARAMPARLSESDMVSESKSDQAFKPSAESYATDIEEGEAIAAQIAQAADSGTSWRSLAVLYRSRAIKEHFEAVLVRHRIPYIVVGDIGFFGRKEVADMMGLVRVLFDRDDLAGWKRLLSAGGFGVTPATLVKRIQPGGSPWEALGDIARARAEKALKLRSILTQVDRFSAQRDAATLDIKAFTTGVVLDNQAPETFTDYLIALWVQYLLPHLRADKEKELAKRFDTQHGESGRRQELLDEYLDQCLEHIRTVAVWVDGVRADAAGWDAILDELALQTDASEESQDAVRLMTVHASKGLEFDRIWYLGGMDISEYDESRRSAVEVEEERRIFYVAITRARSALTITGAKIRWYRGRPWDHKISPFYAEIAGLVPSIEIRQDVRRA